MSILWSNSVAENTLINNVLAVAVSALILCFNLQYVFLDYRNQTASSFCYFNRIPFAIKLTCAAFHTGLIIEQSCFFADNLNHALRTYICTDFASGTFIFKEFNHT